MGADKMVERSLFAAWDDVPLVSEAGIVYKDWTGDDNPCPHFLWAWHPVPAFGGVGHGTRRKSRKLLS